MDKMMGMAPDKYSKMFFESDKHQIGRVYRKAVYREYTDATFTKLKPRGPEWEHLGMLGPALHAEVGDTIQIFFKNNGTQSYSMHPHGVLYEKASEGSYYNDGANDPSHNGVVAPGGTHTYIWQVPERAGPGPNDPSSIVWLYHSHNYEGKDTNAGLIGTIIITRKGMARPDGTPKDVDREFVTALLIIDENNSWYLDQNIKAHTTDPSTVKKLDSSSDRRRRQFLPRRQRFRCLQLSLHHQRLHVRQHADDDHAQGRACPLVSGHPREWLQLPHSALARQRRDRKRPAHRYLGPLARADDHRRHGPRQRRHLDVSLPRQRAHGNRHDGDVPGVAVENESWSHGYLCANLSSLPLALRLKQR